LREIAQARHSARIDLRHDPTDIIHLFGCPADDYRAGRRPPSACRLIWLKMRDHAEVFLRILFEATPWFSRELDSARTGGAHAFEFRHRMRHKNGSYRWVACSGVVARDDAGQAIRLTGSHADVMADSASTLSLASRVVSCLSSD
jgi:hypothetical protein